jgi:hypothetical protein
MTTLRIERPYATVDELLDGDYWTVERSEMLLIGADEVPAGTAVGFEIVLTTGEVAVRGEARALESVPGLDDRPGGLKVRFRQLDTAAKAVLKRALERQRAIARSSPVASPAPAASVFVAPPQAAPPPEASGTPLEAPRPPHVASGDAAAFPPPAPFADKSGIRHRATGPVAPPENRDALLERLRERARAAAPKRSSATG